MNLYIPIILGTARVGRGSEKVANYVLAEVKRRAEIETEIIDGGSVIDLTRSCCKIELGIIIG